MQLDDWLKAENLTEAAFAVRIEVSQAAVNRYRKGQRYPDRRVMRRIMRETLGSVSSEDFLNLIVDDAPGAKATPAPREAAA